MQGLLPIERSRLPAELLAGVTLAALGIPEVLGTPGSPACRW